MDDEEQEDHDFLHFSTNTEYNDGRPLSSVNEREVLLLLLLYV